MIKVMIEAEAGSNNKIEYDKETLKKVSVLTVSLPYPYPYGFVLNTRAPDGDNVDCYVIGHNEPKTGCVVLCEPIGLLEQNESGEQDHKVLAVIAGYKTDYPGGLLKELQQFIYGIFGDYPEESVVVGPIQSRDTALRYISANKLEKS